MSEKLIITPRAVMEAASSRARELIEAGLKSRWRHEGRASKPWRLYGVPRGGLPAVFALACAIEKHSMATQIVDHARDADFIVDDLMDSGKTAARYQALYPDTTFVPLFTKRLDGYGRWFVFPWEIKPVVPETFGGSVAEDTSAEDIGIRLLQYIGEDPTREGLKETPKRFLAAWKEWASGYAIDPSSLLKTFEDGAQNVDELVIVHNIPVISKCEHHLADIIGVAHVGYIPNGKIVGLSKLNRLVDAFARRLQVQERLTNQIAECLEKNLAPVGLGVLIRASHACMSTRGVNQHNGGVTTTSSLRGALKTNPAARSEFLSLCDAAERPR